jgi:hypothetical protein
VDDIGLPGGTHRGVAADLGGHEPLVEGGGIVALAPRGAEGAGGRGPPQPPS